MQPFCKFFNVQWNPKILTSFVLFFNQYGQKILFDTFSVASIFIASVSKPTLYIYGLRLCSSNRLRPHFAFPSGAFYFLFFHRPSHLPILFYSKTKNFVKSEVFVQVKIRVILFQTTLQISMGSLKAMTPRNSCFYVVTRNCNRLFPQSKNNDSFQQSSSMHESDLLLFQRLKNVFYAYHQGCGDGAGVVRSRRFLGGVAFLTTLRVGVGFFCPTPDVQLDHFWITLLNWEFLLKLYSLFRNFCWNRDFLQCTTISIDFNSQISFPLC